MSKDLLKQDFIKIDIKTLIFIKKSSKILKIASFILTILFIYLLITHKFLFSMITSGIAFLFFFFDRWTPFLYRKILDIGIETELPTLLSFLIPYASTSKNLVDLLLELPNSLKLKYIKREIERLKLILSFTQDSRTALIRLSETTPNSRFKRLITEYVQTEFAGTSKNKITMLLYKYTVYAIRDKWKNYMELGKEFGEISIGLVLSVGILTTLILLSSYNLLSIILVLSLILIPTTSIVLMISRPEIGEPKSSLALELITLFSPFITSFLILKNLGFISMIPLIITMPIIEIINIKNNQRIELALTYLREAAEKAKLGKRFDIELKKASILADNVINGILESEKIAGKIGVSSAIEGLMLVIQEARRLSNSIKAESLFMIIIAIISPLVSLLSINIISSTYLNASQLFQINYQAIKLSKIIIASLSPVSVLPISILNRGKNPSLIPSFVATLIILLALK